MKSQLFRLLGLFLLLVTSFVLGYYWQQGGGNQHTSTSPKLVRFESPAPVPPDTATAEKPALVNLPKLNGTELATINLFEEAAPSVCFITTTNLRQDYFNMNITEIPRGNGSGFDPLPYPPFYRVNTG